MKHTKSADSGFHILQNGGAAVGVNLSLNVVRKLHEEAEWALTSNPTGAAEVAGLLLGNPGSVIEINDSEPVLLMRTLDHPYALTGPGGLEFKRMIAAFSTPAPDRRAVGFYRSQIGEKDEPEQEDLTLIRTCFGDMPRVMLLMNRAGDGRTTARLFLEDQSTGLCELCREDDLSSDSEPLNDRADIATKPLTRSNRLTSILSTVNPNGTSPVSRSHSFRFASLWTLQILAACVLVFMILKGSMLAKKAVISASARNETASSIANKPDLALRVEWQGKNLRLSWDGGTSVLSQAKGGALTIREGNTPSREILLDGDLLRTGSILYRPIERDVSFQLAVFGRDSSKIADSVVAAP
jgi:hypothetical protein